MREVAKSLAGAPDFFGVEANVVCVREHFFECESSFLVASGFGEALYEPEGTEAERAFVTAQAVISGGFYVVAINQGVVGKFVLDLIQR